MRVDVVVTTIFEPKWLAGYLDNLRLYEREQQVTLRIICDKKTPDTVYAAARAAARKGFKIDCPTLLEQADYLKRLGFSEDFVPWNSDNRRNIGFLRAWESGADILISIDDDNYCKGVSDFVGEHCVVGQSILSLSNSLSAQNGSWFNICNLLESQVKDVIYPRGFPYAARNLEAQAELLPITPDLSEQKIAINAGLWLDDPDVDAITRLAQRPRINKARKESVILGPETWCPINTQNTAVIREAMPAYYYVRMGYPLGGMTIDRFGDILSGYFVQKCVKHMGQAVRLGSPVADHIRTPHNLFKDLYHELAGIVMVEDLLPWLQQLRISGNSYHEAYASLADNMDAEAHRFTGFVWDDGGSDFLRATARCMHDWLKVLRTIGH